MSIVAHTLLANGLLQQRAVEAEQLLQNCMLCPRQCRVNRLAGETGWCGTGALARIAGYGPHFGEEQPLVGTGGSGAVFIAGCSLCCCFCQNMDISQGDGPADEVDAKAFAAIMLELQARGCHNINLVTPSHVVPQILAALIPALEAGLNIPVVFNCSGYERVETLDLLAGVVDIYMPDVKFWRAQTAERYAQAADYPERMQAALATMHRQVGDLVIDADGLARSGLLIRHLLMPGLMEETEAILAWIATQISAQTYVNIMAQYHPCGRADEYEELRHQISGTEYRHAMEVAGKVGLTRLDEPDLVRILRRLHP
ncbi:radical SAM protein [Desulfobulbus oligotrophicus]|uniref:Radical SAM protein n=1 Tax=Desulfobulbus oligotrophicus TaxID=1909699 RepID=A0A7T5VCC4_9BACT|nr:radical SAM protein [Desulfobulbus oligotrophicus]QQG65171.1 radical SAM protein [Desulfobulbus oligotrophicus]